MSDEIKAINLGELGESLGFTHTPEFDPPVKRAMTVNDLLRSLLTLDRDMEVVVECDDGVFAPIRWVNGTSRFVELGTGRYPQLHSERKS